MKAPSITSPKKQIPSSDIRYAPHHTRPASPAAKLSQASALHMVTFNITTNQHIS
jgi:hypothetical protein